MYYNLSHFLPLPRLFFQPLFAARVHTKAAYADLDYIQEKKSEMKVDYHPWPEPQKFAEKGKSALFVS